MMKVLYVSYATLFMFRHDPVPFCFKPLICQKLFFTLVLAIEATKKFLDENPKASPDDIAELVTNQQMASALKSHHKVQIFVQAAFTPQFFKNKEIPLYAPAISAIT